MSLGKLLRILTMNYQNTNKMNKFKKILNFIFVFAKKTFLFCYLFFFLSACSTVGRLFSTPSYSHHVVDVIKLSNSVNEKKYAVYIKPSNDAYNLYDNVIEDVKKKFISNNINIVDDITLADYIINLNIKNVAFDVDTGMATKIRNSFIGLDVGSNYSFDNKNSPYILMTQFENIKDDNFSSLINLRRRSIAPSILYTVIGSTVGFLLGYFLFPISPIAIGFGGAILFGGITYGLYTCFKDIGIIIVYEIAISEKKKQNILYKRKSVVKIAGNKADEAYYEFSDKYDTFISKQVVIAVGSRALKRQMMQHIYPIISSSITNVFNIK